MTCFAHQSILCISLLVIPTLSVKLEASEFLYGICYLQLLLALPLSLYRYHMQHISRYHTIPCTMYHVPDHIPYTMPEIPNSIVLSEKQGITKVHRSQRTDSNMKFHRTQRTTRKPKVHRTQRTARNYKSPSYSANGNKSKNPSYSANSQKSKSPSYSANSQNSKSPGRVAKSRRSPPSQCSLSRLVFLYEVKHFSHAKVKLKATIQTY